MITVVGDIHSDTQKLYSVFKSLKPRDKIFQLGDLELIWTEQNTKELDYIQNTFSTTELLWIDGNHQNFTRLYSDYEVIQKYGGPVHKIRNNIFHLMRGHIYTIEQKTFFTFGGGLSIDKLWRIPHISWWSEEMPTSFEYETGLTSLQNVNYNVDYIITHSAPRILYKQLKKYIDGFHPFQDSLSEYLNIIYEKCTFRKWFMGHYHIDKIIGNKKYYFVFNQKYILS